MTLISTIIEAQRAERIAAMKEKEARALIERRAVLAGLQVLAAIDPTPAMLEGYYAAHAGGRSASCQATWHALISALIAEASHE